jgi:hypothetical protein
VSSLDILSIRLKEQDEKFNRSTRERERAHSTHQAGHKKHYREVNVVLLKFWTNLNMSCVVHDNISILLSLKIDSRTSSNLSLISRREQIQIEA